VRDVLSFFGGKARTDTEILRPGFKEGVLDGLGCFARCVWGRGRLLARSFGLGLVIETRTISNWEMSLPIALPRSSSARCHQRAQHTAAMPTVYLNLPF
jgi:hypothetical protein